MAMTYIISWPYDDVAEAHRKARDLFVRITEGVKDVPFPYPTRCRVMVVDTPGGSSVHIHGASPDPELVSKLETWVEACGGAEPPTAAETHDVGDEVADITIIERGWGTVAASAWVS